MEENKTQAFYCVVMILGSELLQYSEWHCTLLNGGSSLDKTQMIIGRCYEL